MITLYELSIGIITFRICRPSIFGDRRYWLELSRELRDFPEISQGEKCSLIYH